MNNTNEHNNFTEKNKFFTNILFILSLLFLVLIWTMDIIIKDIPFNFKSIALIHNSFSIWILDGLPFFVAFSNYFLSKRKLEYESKLKKEIDFRNSLLTKYAEDAERLSMEDYSIPIQPSNKNDQLGKSLKFLQGYLRASQRKEKDQYWISEGKETIARILRLYTRIDELAFNVLKAISAYINTEQAAFYIYNEEKQTLYCVASYAYNRKRYINQEFKLGYGLVGQCAYEQDFVYRTEIPVDYISISSGILGDQKPRSILLIPLITDEKLQGVIEIASIQPKMPKLSIQFLLELGEIIARTVYNLKVNQQTEILLNDSRKLTEELKINEKSLHENAELMKNTQLKLQKSNEQLEDKVKETENAQGRLHWLLENASEIISIYNRDLQMTYVSPSVLNILGYTTEEMKFGKDFERLTRKGAQSYRKLIEETIINPKPDKKITYSYISKDGKTIFLESSARNLLNDPAIQGVIINTSDITERIRAEKEERLKTRMQSLSENSLDLIIRLNISGQIHYLNPVVEDYIGISASKMINKNLSEIEFSGILKEYIKDTIIELKLHPQKTNQEITIPLKMGEKLTYRIINFDAIPEFTLDELETILFVGHDITESKHIEKEIQIKNKNIQDSINYAEKIQKALLPEIDYIKKNLPKSFVYYKPRDVISGDFPWFMELNGEMLIAAADCTGHGVPGALLSFIAFFLLKDVVVANKSANAGEICDSLHKIFRKTLKQNTKYSDTRDGLDIALCKINPEKNELEYAGAHRPLFVLSEGELTEYKGNRKAIGGIELLKKADEKFINHRVKFKKGDKMFFFTDGLTDQLGGPYGRKYSPKRVREQLLENPGFTMKQFHQLFNDDFDHWKKDFKQLDDVLMIGIEF